MVGANSGRPHLTRPARGPLEPALRGRGGYCWAVSALLLAVFPDLWLGMLPLNPRLIRGT